MVEKTGSSALSKALSDLADIGEGETRDPQWHNSMIRMTPIMREGLRYLCYHTHLSMNATLLEAVKEYLDRKIGPNWEESVVKN